MEEKVIEALIGFTFSAIFAIAFGDLRNCRKKTCIADFRDRSCSHGLVRFDCGPQVPASG